MSLATNSDFDDTDLDLSSRPSSEAHPKVSATSHNGPNILRIPSVSLGPQDSVESLGNPNTQTSQVGNKF